MSQPAISQHLKVLERAGLLSRTRERTRNLSRPRSGTSRRGDRVARGVPQVSGEAAFSAWTTCLVELKARASRVARRIRRRIEKEDWRRDRMTTAKTLEVSTPTDCAIALTRVFDAPRELVFEAYTRPALLKRWFHPQGWSLVVCEVDLRVGGRWRFEMEKVNGARWASAASTRKSCGPSASSRARSSTALGTRDAVSTVTSRRALRQDDAPMTVVYESKEVRTVIASGMETGVGGELRPPRSGTRIASQGRRRDRRALKVRSGDLRGAPWLLRGFFEAITFEARTFEAPLAFNRRSTLALSSSRRAPFPTQRGAASGESARRRQTAAPRREAPGCAFRPERRAQFTAFMTKLTRIGRRAFDERQAAQKLLVGRRLVVHGEAREEREARRA